MDGLNDTTRFDQASLQRVISFLTETRDDMIKLKEEFIEYNETKLKKYWISAGSIVAQSRLESFINNDIESLIKYINQGINNLQDSVPDVNNMNEA